MKKIIDIRDNYEYRIGHIDGAINIPRDLLELDTKKYINKKDKYKFLLFLVDFVFLYYSTYRENGN